MANETLPDNMCSRCQAALDDHAWNILPSRKPTDAWRYQRPTCPEKAAA